MHITADVEEGEEDVVSGLQFQRELDLHLYIYNRGDKHETSESLHPAPGPYMSGCIGKEGEGPRGGGCMYVAILD